jgi:hypothetical protein
VALRSLRNHRNFFSDYWLSSLLGARGLPGPRLNAQQQRRRMAMLARLMDLVDRPAGLNPSRFRERFARPLLEDVLDFGAVEPADGEINTNILALTAGAVPLEERSHQRPLVLARLSPQLGDHETPVVRRSLEHALLESEIDHGFIITPDTLRLIKRPGAGPRGAALDIALATMVEMDDAESLAAAYRILSAESFAVNGDGRRPIDVLEAESREHSARVSSDLKTSVFEAAERIVGAFLRDVQNRPDAFAPDTPSVLALRDSGFLALYRLLFILYAEARDERLATHPLYRGSYSLESLVARLALTPVEAQPGNLFRLWAHVLALFRVFNEGVAPHLPDFENIPSRGGRLFSDETPDGDLLRRLQVDDRTCASILLALATTRPRRGIGRERVSFRELAIEQLGAVYEGLLEYEPTEATEVRIAVRAQSDSEIALTPSEIVFLCEQKGLTLAGDSSLIEGTEAARLHPDNAANEEDNSGDSENEDLEEDESENGEAVELTSGGKLRLVRRLEPGTFYFRPGGARKASGSFYTPTPMVDDLVRGALGPLTDGKTAAQIEALRVIDPACGSAHFLVGAARYLGARLHEAYRTELGAAPPETFIPGGTADDRRRGVWRARWESEGQAWCVRRVVERCLYGVDYNPAAVQLAQVSLWIESLAGDRPLSFFAHHIRVGNSLLGTWADRFDAPPDPQLAERGDRLTRGLFEASIRNRILAALEERRLIDAELPPEVRADTPEEYEYKEDRLRRAEAALADARLLLDLRSASPFLPTIWHDLPTMSEAVDVKPAARARGWWDEFVKVRERERFFHWELEFPEVMLRPERPGFDAVLGNPPWDKVLPSKHEFYATADPLIRAFKGNELDARIRELGARDPTLGPAFGLARERMTTIARVLRGGGDFPLAQARSQAAHEDLAKYFVDRALRIVRSGGSVGLVVPSVVYNGDGCVGIRAFLLRKAEITRFYGFENRRKIFPIHAMYKFVNLIARPGAGASGEFDAAFMRHYLEELSDSAPKPWMVRITRDEIERLSPDTFAFLEYRGPRDQEVARKMAKGRPTLGGTGKGGWGTRLMSWRAHETIFNATEDKDLFTDPRTHRLHSPASVLGQFPQSTGELFDAMRARGFWPVFEGKHIDQYLVGTKPVRWWLSVEQAERKYGRAPRAAETLVFRETASNTNERTCIAAVLPLKSAASHKLTGMMLQHVSSDAALAVLNSFCFDFSLRLRTAGTNVSFTYILPVAVPQADVVNDLSFVTTRRAWETGLENISDDEALWPLLWQSNYAVALAYGLDAADFSHILSTFPVFRRKRPALYDFFAARLADWNSES